jgi:AAA15 family ATPase/GTPase
MLIQFSVDNFRSIKDTVTLSMISGSDNDKNDFSARNYRLLRSAVIYGANASGKSNVLLALAFMRSLVLNEHKIVQSTDVLPHQPFRLSTETEKASSTFEAVFIMDDIKYRYGFEADSTAVFGEWLYEDSHGREATLFFRDTDEERLTVNKNRFPEGRGLKVLDNSLFLWRCDQNGGEIAQRILRWFSNLNLLYGMNPSGYLRYTVDQMEHSEFRRQIMNLVHVADLGIEEIAVEKRQITKDEIDQLTLPEAVRSDVMSGVSPVMRVEIGALHGKYDADDNRAGTETFELGTDESEGTKKYFSLSAPILDTLRRGRILLIDELDASLHPMLVANLVSLFNRPEVNPHNAQLIFVTHDTNLLNQNLFHKSQIWFTEKDRQGSTHLTSLVEFRGIRKADNIEKHYIQGKYGAIPYLGDFSRAISIQAAE